MRVLLIRRHVSAREFDVNAIDGFLALFEIQLAFVPSSKLSPQQHKYLCELCTKSRQALWKQQTLNADPLNFIELPECIATDLDMIHMITLENVLTLSARGNSVCLVEMRLMLQEQTTDGDHVLLLSLHFECNKFNHPPTLLDVTHELTAWFKAIRKSLAPFSAHPNAFIVTDLIEGHDAVLMPDPITGIMIENRWNAQTQNPVLQLATNIGNLGFTFASLVVGKPRADRLVSRVEDVTWDVIDTLSRVTEFSRDTTATALEHPLSRPILPYIPEQIRGVFLTTREVNELLDTYDSAGEYISRWGEEMVRVPTVLQAVHVDETMEYACAGLKPVKPREPLGLEEFELLKERNKELVMRSRGVASNARHVVWKHLFTSALTDTEKTDQAYSLSTFIVNYSGQYYAMKQQWQTILSEAADNPHSDAPSSPVYQPNVAPGDERDGGPIITKIRDRKYRIGNHHSISLTSEKDVVRTDRQVDFFRGLDSDQASPPTDEEGKQLPFVTLSPNLAMLRDILLTYTLYDYELGYVQGMNDFLAPLLYIYGSINIATAEVDSFWHFCSLMKRMASIKKKSQ